MGSISFLAPTLFIVLLREVAILDVESSKINCLTYYF